MVSKKKNAKKKKQNIAVIQNEYAAGLGAENELSGSARAACTAEIYETASGCLCCGGRGDFVAVLHQLIPHRSRFDQLIIETTGLADPSFMQAFFADPTLASAYKLASVVCVVDVQDVESRLDQPPVIYFSLTLFAHVCFAHMCLFVYVVRLE